MYIGSWVDGRSILRPDSSSSLVPESTARHAHTHKQHALARLEPKGSSLWHHCAATASSSGRHALGPLPSDAIAQLHRAAAAAAEKRA